MRKIFFRDYWLYRNIFDVLMIPITVLSVILGLHAEIFDNNRTTSVNHWDFLKKNGIDIFHQDTLSIITETNSKTSDTIYHLILLDRTLSTRDAISADSINVLYNSLYIKNKNSFNYNSIFGSNSPSLKELAILNFYSHIPVGYNIMYCPVFYDGNYSGLKSWKELSTDTAQNDSWYLPSNENTKFTFLQLLQNIPAFKLIDGQKTFFKPMIDSIAPKFLKNTMIVTIISDFVNDGENLNEDFLGNIQCKTKIKQLNIIYIPPQNIADKQKSSLLINVLQSCFEKTINFHEVNFNDYTNFNLYNYPIKQFYLETDQALTPCEYVSNSILIYFPRNHEKGISIGKSTVVNQSKYLSNNIKWRIISTFPTLHKEKVIANYKTNKEKNQRGFLIDNSWYDFPGFSDTLFLDFYYVDQMNNANLFFEIFDRDKNFTLRYPIKTMKTFPRLSVLIGEMCISCLLIIFLFLIITQLRKTWDMYNWNYFVFNSGNFNLYFISELIIVFPYIIIALILSFISDYLLLNRLIYFFLSLYLFLFGKFIFEVYKAKRKTK